ncbi:hypothetical protein HPB52_023664 [Rhipicephalus sanguineus]|uniref:Uncharacterized protein n=1 Tax=Rhipicephalus sanguineus TaxID=34632 RepID=A0A9D4Q8U9_RHISA|nr:hypothetical protein HPB52_023664 [Rhipicephalus sanguineus]
MSIDQGSWNKQLLPFLRYSQTSGSGSHPSLFVNIVLASKPVRSSGHRPLEMEQLRTKRRFIQTVATKCLSTFDILLADRGTSVSTLLQHINLILEISSRSTAQSRTSPNDDALKKDITAAFEKNMNSLKTSAQGHAVHLDMTMCGHFSIDCTIVL